MPEQFYPFLLGAAFMAYLQASITYQLLLALRRPRYGRWGTIGLAAGIAVHTAALLIAWLESGRPVFGVGANTLAYYAWLTVAIYLALEFVLREKALGAIVAPFACLSLLGAILLPRQVSETLRPFAGNSWLAAHVGVSFASYAAFTVAAGSALLYLAQERQLKSRRWRAFVVNLPPLGTLEVLTYRLIEIGFVLLSATILVGGLVAQQAWDSYWSWEPKQTATLATWLVYLGYFLLRNVTRLSGGQTARCAVAGFAAILVSYLAVNLLLPGQHTFGLVERP